MWGDSRSGCLQVSPEVQPLVYLYTAKASPNAFHIEPGTEGLQGSHVFLHGHEASQTSHPGFLQEMVIVF